MKSGFIAIAGRPSSGKSTLMNALCGHKIAITTPVPQTTRKPIRGVFTDNRGQIVFIDTPGVHDSNRTFNTMMLDLVKNSVKDAEAVLYVIDASRKPGPEEDITAKLVAECGLPVVIAINKTDMENICISQIKGFCRERVPGAGILQISAVTGDNTEKLVSSLFDALPEGEIMYPDDHYTDQTPEFRIAEIIREQAMLNTAQEIPHSLYVEIADLELDASGDKMWVRAFIIVERESQKGMVVGRGGNKIKLIRTTSQKALHSIFSQKIHLDIRVKVNPKWRKKEYLLKGLFGQ